MDKHTLAKHLKEIALRIDACRNDIPEVYPLLMDAYITIDPENRSQYPSQNQNRVLYPGCVNGMAEDDVRTMIELFEGKHIPHFFIVLSPCPQMEDIRKWVIQRGGRPFQGTGYPTLLRPAELLPLHETRLEIHRITAEDYDRYSAGLENIYRIEADQYLFKTSLGESGFGHFIACDGDQAVAAGMICMHEEVGYLYSGGTLGTHRGQGAQNALIVARNNYAVACGCRWVSSETLYFLEQSLSNLQRQRFEIVYDKDTYVWKSKLQVVG